MVSNKHGTSCESSKVRPCPERAHTLYKVHGSEYRLWICEGCAGTVNRATFGRGLTPLRAW